MNGNIISLFGLAATTLITGQTLAADSPLTVGKSYQMWFTDAKTKPFGLRESNKVTVLDVKDQFVKIEWSWRAQIQIVDGKKAPSVTRKIRAWINLNQISYFSGEEEGNAPLGVFNDDG